MATWDTRGNPWILNLDKQTVLLNTQGTYVENNLEIDVVSGNAGAVTAGNASIDTLTVDDPEYFTNTPNTNVVRIRADASVGTTSVSDFAAGWVDSAPTITQGSPTSTALTKYIKDAVISNSTTDQFVTSAGWLSSLTPSDIKQATVSSAVHSPAATGAGVQVISGAGWISSLEIDKITSNVGFEVIADSSSVIAAPYKITNNNTTGGTTLTVQLDGSTGDNSFIVGVSAVDEVTVQGKKIIDSGVWVETQFKQGSTVLSDDSITITGPSDPITVTGSAWNSTTKTINVNLSTTSINSTGETTLTQISGGISSGGNTYLGFSGVTGAVVDTAGYVAADTTYVTDSSIQTAILYYAGAIDQPTD